MVGDSGQFIEGFYRSIKRLTLAEEVERKRDEIRREGLLYYVLREATYYSKGRTINRVLELGGGSGANLFLLKERVSIVEAVSLDLVPPTKVMPGVTYLTGNASELPPVIQSASVDIVLMVEVLAHVLDTDAAVREARRVLVPGGLLIVTTPNMSSLISRLSLAFGWLPVGAEVSSEKVFGRPGTRIVGHLRLFTFEALREFLRYHRFKLLSIYTVAESYTFADDANDLESAKRHRRFAALVDRVAVRFSDRLGYRMIAIAMKT